MNPESGPRPAGTAPSFDRTTGLSAGAIRLLQETHAALAQRNGAEVQRRLVALMALAPTHPEVLRLRAAVAHLQGRATEGVELLKRAFDARPGDTQTAIELGTLLARGGDVVSASDVLRRNADAEPLRAAPLMALSQILERNADGDGAIDALREAVRREPAHVTARNLLARALHFAGRVGDAESTYRETLRAAPDSPMAWYGLSTLRTVRLGADDLAALEALVARGGLHEQERAPALFALAKAFEDNARYADAFRTLTQANATRRAQLRWDAAKFSANARAIKQAFDAPPEPQGDGGHGLIFIVGMPRSGSTLVEQILAAHPDVATGGELDDVRDIILAESQRREADFPGWVATATADDWRRLGHRYLDRISRRRGTKAWFTDKALLNWRYLGALRAMLPGARFVDCRRDAVETCLGCYRQLFANELAFTYDLAELASFWRDYDRLMRFWGARFPERILELSHEALTANPEAEIRRLLDFCGLPFDAACLAFHDSARSVRTASAAQVREPLRADTARAVRYGELLDPLRELLKT
ncbi:MAG TPA: sulfotransferase [Rhodanobacteraceae bacterium]|nr:sulfotransferase [Rhodanobacteraceae bacterium]